MIDFQEKFEKKLKLLKFLHKPHTTQECAKELDVSEKTIRRYIKEGDIVIDNVIIPFDIQKMKYYEFYSDVEHTEEFSNNKEINKSSVHPVLLPLNLTEVYMLTNGILDILGPRHPLYGQYKEIANKIYSQLSDYARTRIIAAKHGLEKKDRVEFISENKMIENDSWTALAKAQKGGWEVRITCYNGEVYEGVPKDTNLGLYLKKDNEMIDILSLGISEIKLLNEK